MNNDHLLEIEEIKKLKARYFRYMDKQLWDQWKEVFTEDVVFHIIHDGQDICWNGREEVVANNMAALKDGITVHHGHMPEIEIIDERTARGIWAMFDYVDLPRFVLKGYGHYEEEYVKENGRWKIRRLKLTRIRADYTSKES